MLAGEGEMIPPVEELVVSGLGCSRLREDQEGALAVAAALQVAQDVRDVVEVCAAQLVRENPAGWVPRSLVVVEFGDVPMPRKPAFLLETSTCFLRG